MSAEILNLYPGPMSFTPVKINYKMKNPLKSDTFNRFDATKDRSPRFRAFVIILLLAVSCFLVYVSAFRKDTTEFTKGSISGHHANVGRLEQPTR